jgi:ATP-binding cassette subfamily B protein
VYAVNLAAVTLVKNHLNRSVSAREELIQNSHAIHLSQIKASLSFEQTEDPAVLDLCSRVEKNDMPVILKSFHDFSSAVAQLATLLGITSLVVLLNPWLVLLLVVVFVSNYFVSKRMNEEGFRYMSEVAPLERREGYLIDLMENYEYGKEVRINQLFPYIRKKYEAFFPMLRRAYQKIFYSNLKAYWFENGMMLVQTGGIYILLALEVVRKGLGIGDFTMYFNAVNQFSNSISAVLKGYLSLSKMSLYVGDLEKLTALPTMNAGQAERRPLPKPPFTFQFQDVSFRYPGHEDYALRHVNLLLRPEERLALVGANGAGKTTLVKLLLRLYRPTEGRIYLNGADIQSFDYADYAKLFSVVFQDYKLFAFSIEENIRFEEEGGEERVWESLEKSGMKEKVEGLAQREKTRLYRAYDEEGIELSGGESQKVGIARALYKDGKVVILDEPTASLDPLSEYEIYRRMDRLVERKTSIYITHRLSSTRFSDRIVVLEKGRVEEEGSHEELLRRGGLYSRMFHLQADAYSQS